VQVRERVRKLIEDRGMKQIAVARRMGEQQSWLNNRLTGYTEIKADEIERIAEALRVSPCALVDDREMTRAIESSTHRRHADPGPDQAEGERIAMELQWAWSELPEAEREFVLGLVELRRRYRDRTSNP
jgi:transcriptional regulator with XRE-family HTH domain